MLVGYYRLLAGILAAGDVPLPPAATGETRTKTELTLIQPHTITTQGE